MARPGRLELPTLCLEGRRSFQLSYGRSIDSKRFPARETNICYVRTPWKEFLIHAQSRLGDDSNDVAHVFLGMGFDALLLRPGYKVRPEQCLKCNGELDARTRIRGDQFLSNGYIQQTPQHPKFLMNRCWRHNSSSFVIPSLPSQSSVDCSPFGLFSRLGGSGRTHIRAGEWKLQMFPTGESALQGLDFVVVVT